MKITINLNFDERCRLRSLIKRELKNSIKDKRKYEKQLKNREVAEDWIDTTKHIIGFLDENIKIYKSIYNQLKEK